MFYYLDMKENTPRIGDAFAGNIIHTCIAPRTAALISRLSKLISTVALVLTWKCVTR